MISVRKERRHRMVVKLICEKLGIDDKELNVYIEKGTVKPLAQPEKVAAPKKVVETGDKKK